MKLEPTQEFSVVPPFGLLKIPMRREFRCIRVRAGKTVKVDEVKRFVADYQKWDTAESVASQTPRNASLRYDVKTDDYVGVYDVVFRSVHLWQFREDICEYFPRKVFDPTDEDLVLIDQQKEKLSLPTLLGTEEDVRSGDFSRYLVLLYFLSMNGPELLGTRKMNQPARIWINLHEYSEENPHLMVALLGETW